jgi:hypothetical protein
MNLLIPSPYCYIVGALIWIIVIGTFVRSQLEDYNHDRAEREYLEERERLIRERQRWQSKS